MIGCDRASRSFGDLDDVQRNVVRRRAHYQTQVVDRHPPLGDTIPRPPIEHLESRLPTDCGTSVKNPRETGASI